MIVVRLIGGLGNQMFQYAAGRALAERIGGSLRFDVSGFADYPGREYALGHYPVKGRVADAEDLERFPPDPGSRGRLARLADRVLLGRTAPTRFREPHFHYTSDFQRLRGDVYLDGYWQSERYFASVVDAVRKELTLPAALPDGHADLAERIGSVDAVSVHVRRGDYVSDPRVAQVHGALSQDYFRYAAERASDGFSSPEFFVFTDDPDWVRGELDLGVPFTLVEDGAPHEDLRLMSLCRGHAVANSSFSWWGAWLCSHRMKRIVAPVRWFGEQRRSVTRMDDLLPQGWERV